MKVLGIIPARGGSKRVPGKNIKILGGKPLIQYTIEAAMESKLLVDFIVTTDDLKIAEISKSLGAKAPFIRPPELSEDTTGDRPVLLHALNWYLLNCRSDIDAVCILRPTSPLRTSELIDKGVDKLINSECDSIRSMTVVEGVHHPYWMFKEVDGIAKSVIESVSIDKYYQSQLLPPVYRLNGCVDFIKIACLKDDKSSLYGNNMKILRTKEKEGLDIDTLQDFEYCEWLISRK